MSKLIRQDCASLRLKVNDTQAFTLTHQINFCLRSPLFVRFNFFKPSAMKTLKVFVPTLVIGFSAFGLGHLSALSARPQAAPMCMENGYREIAIIEFKEMVGDSLKADLSGKARLVWNGDFVEGEGEHLIAVSQLPSEHDADFRSFAYVGNAGTMKFYPSNTYAARGTDPLKRRFFVSREAAETEGFVASKLVK